MIGAIQNILQVWNPTSKVFFNKHRSSDELKYVPLVPAFLNSLEPLLSLESYTKSVTPQL
jgi:hypothetical protein